MKPKEARLGPRLLGGVCLLAAGTVLVWQGFFQDARAYVQSIKKEADVLLRWEGTNCVSVRMNTAGSDDIDDGSEFLALEKAADNWNLKTQHCSYIHLDVKPPSATVKVEYKSGQANETDIVWIEQNWATDSEHDPGVIALTSVRYVNKAGDPRDGVIVDADIEINGVTFRYATDGNPQRIDVENTLTHELGHVLGLEHPCYLGSQRPVPTPKDQLGNPIPSCDFVTSEEVRQRTMFPSADAGDTTRRSLEADDILGICEIYPKAEDPGRCGMVFGKDGGCSIRSARGSSMGNPWLVPLFVGVFLWIFVKRRKRA